MEERDATQEERSEFEEFTLRLEALCREAPSYDTALQALTQVLAQLCTEVDNEAAVCLTVCEDLLTEFRQRMESRPAEIIVNLPEQD